MGDAKQTEDKQAISFTERKLEEDKWYFIELYHLNGNDRKNLSLYIDFKLVKDVVIKSYVAQLNYDENTIGCGIQLEYIGKKGQESIINNFCGEMTVLHFFEVSSKTMNQMHDSLTFIEKDIGLENFSSDISTRQDTKHVDISIMEKMFMHVNPKYIDRITQYKQKADTIIRKGKNIDIYNSVERIYAETIVDHNMVAKDNFLNIGGIKLLFPAFYKIVEGEPNEKFG
jgi:hypothetical protein